MAFIPFGNVFAIDVIGSQNAEPFDLTFAFHVDTLEYNLVGLQGVLTGMSNWYNAELKVQLPSNAIGAKIVGRALDSQFSFVAEDSAIAGIAGTQATDGVNGLCKAFTRRSGYAGRSYRGRVFIPVPQGRVETNETLVSTAWCTSVIAALEELNAAVQIEVGSAEGVILSRQINGVARIEGVATPIAGWGVSDFTLDTCRKRMAH